MPGPGHPPSRPLAALIAILLALITTQSAAQSEIDLQVINLGVAGAARQGEWVGTQIGLKDNASEIREIILRISIETPTATKRTSIASSPPTRVSTNGSGSIGGSRPRVSTARSTSTPTKPSTPDRVNPDNSRTEKDGASRPTTVYNPRINPPEVANFGIVGPRQLGLDGYSITVGNVPARPFSHEHVRIASGLDTPSMPDRWMGYAPIDVLVWGSSTLREHDPSSLSPERARAIKDWITRGGHLVVVLPPADDPWFSSPHALTDSLPRITRVNRADGRSYEPYRSLLTTRPDITLPTNASIHTFELPEDDPDTIPVLTDPDGNPIVIRRNIGSGAVTIVGLDLAHGELRRLGLPSAESFWHRTLGMRGRIATLDQMSEQEIADADSRTVLGYDTTTSSEIAKTGRAVQGILFGLLVFAFYWIVAGPVGFWILKKRNATSHAWVGFVIAIVGFAVASWVGASLMRPRDTTITHLTLFEQVSGQTDSRARSWVSVMLPGYGSAEVSVEPDDASSPGPNLITPWEPGIGSVLTSGFPDNTGYRIESRAPDKVLVPTRATVKQFRIDAAGQDRWAGITPVSELASGQPGTIVRRGAAVAGQIEHDFPAPLTDLRIIVVRDPVPILTPGARLDSGLIARTTIWSPTFQGNGWNPGERLSLLELTTPSVQNPGDARQFLLDAVRDGIDAFSLQSSPGDLDDRLVAARLISMLEPPNYSTNDRGVSDRQSTRREMHTWDLGRWFTSPCVIIMGIMNIDEPDTNALPFGVKVNDSQIPASGTTLVTWIHPLAPDPPDWPDPQP